MSTKKAGMAAKCTTCLGGGFQTVTVVNGMTGVEESVSKMPCIRCGGSGEAKDMKVFAEDMIEWCECPAGSWTFGSYPEDGACGCGTWKHHVHCGTCGNVSQLG